MWKYPFLFTFNIWLTLAKSLSHVRLFVTPWTVARQAPLSMGFSRQEHWSGLPCPPPGDLPKPGTEPTSLSLLHWQSGSLPLAPLGSTCYLPKLVTWARLHFIHHHLFQTSHSAGQPHERHVPLEPSLAVSFSFSLPLFLAPMTPWISIAFSSSLGGFIWSFPFKNRGMAGDLLQWFYMYIHIYTF